MNDIKPWHERSKEQEISFDEARDEEISELRARLAALEKQTITQLAPETTALEERPKLTVRLTSFPESNGKRNWTALLVRVDEWDGLIGNCGGISLARGELWNRVAWAAEEARFLIGERDIEPFILDYGNDIKTPEEWNGEISLARLNRHKADRPTLSDESLPVNS